MSRRLVVLTEIISPYRIPLFNALARRPEVDLHVIFLAETDPGLRQWQVNREEIQFSYEVLPSWRKRLAGYSLLLNTGLGTALRKTSPDVILCGGYNYLASWRALGWAKAHHIPFLLWSESNVQDARRGHAAVELLKSEFLRQCSGFVVPGQSARRYLLSHKIKEEKIFAAPNAVDNDFYAAAAADARQNAIQKRAELGLPDSYFLFAGRLVQEKGPFELLSAYAKLDEATRDRIGLVFAGGGKARPALEGQAAAVSTGSIRFTGFVQREQLAACYALAAAMILPTYSDTWGLVVNEAMACGLPVILSRAAGCAEDLVTENWNGLMVPPKDEPSLTEAMQRLAADPVWRASMGANSLTRIAGYSADAWSTGILKMMETAGAVRE